MLRSSFLQHRLVFVLVSSLALLLISAPLPRVHAQRPLRGAKIVRNDGRTLEIRDSPLTFAPSHAVTIAKDQLRNQTVPAKSLTLFAPQPNADGGNDEPSPTSIIGADERVLVSDTTVFPYSAIVELEVNFRFTSVQCSGWMIGPDMIATAGHCLYYGSFGGWAESITAYPGRNGANAPFGSFAARYWSVPNRWINKRATGMDYGVIQLDTPIGNTVGYFGYRYTDKENFFPGRAAAVGGYPGDKINEQANTQWTMQGQISNAQPRRLFYPMDTYAGQSGAPLYGRWNNRCNPCGFGIHTYGVGGGWTENSATRITDRVFNFFQSASAP
ncbi:MAG: serine protease [Chloroflexi bacterium]|nr:serine protease [Chloroflexota bacterium]